MDFGNSQQEPIFKVNKFPLMSSLTDRESLYLEYYVKNLRMTDALRELHLETKMPITQENGQRRYGPPEDYDGPLPEKGSEIFVGKLPRDIYESELVPIFEKVGNIFELRLMMDFSGTNRGYCFVQYYTAQEARTAVKELNDFEIRPGRFIGVVKSVDNCRLFVGGLPKDKTKEEILREIRHITEGVTRVICNPCPTDRSKNRGYAFIEYESHRAAAMARRKMLPGKLPMFGVQVAVDWAEPEPDVQNLYVRNLSLSTTEEELESIFNRHSQNGVDKVKKIKDFAFIHFLSRMQAEEALEALNETEIDGALVEINWAKPVNKLTHKARKALAKQMYTYPPTARGNDKQLLQPSSERVFGQFPTLGYEHQVANHELARQQQNQYHRSQNQHNEGGRGNHVSFQYNDKHVPPTHRDFGQFHCVPYEEQIAFHQQHMAHQQQHNQFFNHSQATGSPPAGGIAHLPVQFSSGVFLHNLF